MEYCDKIYSKDAYYRGNPYPSYSGLRGTLAHGRKIIPPLDQSIIDTKTSLRYRYVQNMIIFEMLFQRFSIVSVLRNL